jgi:nucleobase:cation symporter-1, NCS1 family
VTEAGAGAFGGTMPDRENDLRTLETRGMAPIPLGNRYGGVHRVFTVWFAPNLVIAPFFIGTLATASFVGVGFTLGVAAIVIGTVLGALPAAYMCSWGPRTGVAQLPLARIPFGKTVVLPGLLLWLSAIAWDAINGIFGGQALQLLFRIPFWLGLLIILALQGLIGVFGYEVLHTFQKWMSVVLGVMYVILTVKIASVGDFSAPATAHGGALVGGFLLMVALTVSGNISWAPCASDYSRYMKPQTSPAAIFWATLGGLTLSWGSIEFLGLIAARLATNATTGGIRTIMGGGTLGALALGAIGLGTVADNAMNDYSGSLALQAAGVRILRPLVAAIVTAAAFGLTLWLNTGNLASKFTNLLLFISYWNAPFAAIVIVDWLQRSGRLDVTRILRPEALRTGWSGLVALAAGFGAAVPFMNTTLFVGPVSAHLLSGGDLAYPVGFVVAAVVFAVASRIEGDRPATAGRRTVLASAAADGDPETALAADLVPAQPVASSWPGGACGQSRFTVNASADRQVPIRGVTARQRH